VSQTALEILLKAKDETGAAFKLLNQSLKNLDQNGKRTESALGDLKKQAVSMAADFISFGAAVKLVTSSLAAQAQSEASVNKLNLALANQGKFTSATSKALTEYASELQRTTTFEDDATVAAMSLLASFGMNEDQIKRTTAAAADFAAATGTDMETAVNLLGRAFAGNTQALGRYGIVVDENIPKGEKFEAVMKQLEQRFGGQAVAAAATYTGQMKQLSNAFGDVQESLGKLLGEMGNAGGGVNFLKSGLEWLSGFFGGTLIIALGEARAQVLNFFAFMSDSIAKVATDLTNDAAKHPILARLLGINGGVLADAGKAKTYFSDLSASLRLQMKQIREESEQAAASVGKVLGVTNAPPGAGTGGGGGKPPKAKKGDKYNPAIGMTMTDLADLQREFNEWWLADTKRTEDALAKLRLDARKDSIATIEGWEKQSHMNALALLDKLKKEQANSLSSHMKGALGQLGPTIMAALQGGGSVVKSVTGLFGGALGEGLQAGATKALGFLGKTLSSTLGSMLPGIGSALGALAGGLFGKLFGGDKYKAEVTKLKDDFVSAAGGMAELQKKAAAAGVSLQSFLANTRDVTKMKSEIEKLQSAFRLQSEAQEKLNEAVQRYGLTIEELGPKWAEQKLGEQAAQLLQDYELLKASGADMNAVLAKMAPSINEYVASAIRAGQAIPEAMKPVIDQMIAEGKLLDENGQAYESAEAAGVTYAKTMTEAFAEMIAAIRELVAALGGVPSAVPGGTRPPAGKPVPPDEQDYYGGGDYPQMARGGVVLPFAPRAANGIVAAKAGGTPVIVGEGGQAELVAPVRALAREIGAAAAAASGGGGDVYVFIDGQQLDARIERRTRTGHTRVDAAGIRRRG
jgi:hypothetical protein